MPVDDHVFIIAEMVRAVRAMEAALGTPNYEVSAQNRRFARSLYVCKDVRKGERFTAKNVRSVRPSNGLHPKYYEEVMGSVATQDIVFGTPLRMGMWS